MKNKALITGCGGMLGKAAYKILSEKYDVIATDINLNEPWLSYLDVRELNHFENYFRDHNFDIIFHLAALTDLEYCEQNLENSWKTNALSAENAALIAKKYDCKIVYISTAGIFDTVDQEKFTDFDIPTPKSIYGKSKYYGEKIVQLVPKHFVFRAGWMMGGEEKDMYLRIIKASGTIYYASKPYVHHIIPVERATKKFIEKQAIGVGMSEKARVKGNVFEQTKSGIKEVAKWLATILICTLYLFSGKQQQIGMLLKFRYWVSKGLWS